MQAIILAAGIAKRMRPLSDKIPKCLFTIKGKSFLERIIENLLNQNIDDIYLITGYKSDMIKEYVNEKFPDNHFQFIINPLFDKTNNSYSLWLAKDKIQQSFILIEGDVLFDKRILANLINNPLRNLLVVKNDEELGEEEMKIIADSDLRITQINKNLDTKLSKGEYIGILKMSEKFAGQYFKKLDENIQEGLTDEYYEKTIQDIIDEGYNIYYMTTDGLKTIEVDFPEDLKKAETDILPYIQ